MFDPIIRRTYPAMGQGVLLAIILSNLVAPPARSEVEPLTVSRSLLTFARLIPTDGGEPLFENQQIQFESDGVFSEESTSHVEDNANDSEGFASQSSDVSPTAVTAVGSYHSASLVDFLEYDFGQGLGISNFRYVFEVHEITNFELMASLVATGSGFVTLWLQGPSSHPFSWNISDDELDATLSGSLEAGTYTLRAQTLGYGTASEHPFTPGTGSFDFELLFLDSSSAPDPTGGHQVSSELRVSPNPARDAVAIDLGSESSHPQQLEVFDVTGKSVRTLPPATGRLANWDTRDERGMRVPPGLYFFRAGENLRGRVLVLGED